MKKTTLNIASLILCALLAVFCLCACSNSDSTAQSTSEVSNSSLIGTWESIEAPGTFFTFNEDGSGIQNSGQIILNFTFSDKGTTVEITYEGTAEPQVCEYTIDGDKLSMLYPDTNTTLTYVRSNKKSADAT